jgi:hypothetical protein
MSKKRTYQWLWDRLMEDVDAAVEAGESRREVMEWAYAEYDAYALQANAEIYGPGPAVFDGDW